jgi:hypothetical protein
MNLLFLCPTMRSVLFSLNVSVLTWLASALRFDVNGRLLVLTYSPYRLITGSVPRCTGRSTRSGMVGRWMGEDGLDGGVCRTGVQATTKANPRFKWLIKIYM